jgi:hypothetical protein
VEEALALDLDDPVEIAGHHRPEAEDGRLDRPPHP